MGNGRRRSFLIFSVFTYLFILLFPLQINSGWDKNKDISSSSIKSYQTDQSIIQLFISSFKEKLTQWMIEHPFIIFGIAIYFILTLFWFLLLWVRPIWLLRINDVLKPYTDFKLPKELGGMQLPIRYVLLVGFFHYHRRVLDAWVAKYINPARENFQIIDTVKDRAIHISVPVILNDKKVLDLTGKKLYPIFAEKRGCLLIWGEGGSGKTSIVCQIAKWAMSDNRSERLCRHFMLPVLVENELDFELAENKQSFKHLMEAIRGLVQILTNEGHISVDLLEHLLKHRRILVIVDRFSEMSDDTRKKIRPSLPDFPAHALVLTSRTEEGLEGILKTIMKPFRIKSDQLSSFMDAYLTERGKRDLFKDAEFFDACGRLSNMVGERDITILFAKLYADQMILSKEDLSETELPDNIPDLMLNYLNVLNRNAMDNEPDNRTVHRDVKAIAWECLKRTYRPTPAKRDDVIAVLGGDAAEIRLKYLEDRLQLIRTVGSAKNQIRFTLDPLAEYLAGSYLVEQYGRKEVLWGEFIETATKMPGAPEDIREFLLAVTDCCLAKGVSHEVPDFVAQKLGKIAGFDPEVIKRVQWWKESVTANCTEHFIAGRIDLNEHFNYCQQRGCLTPFKLYLLDEGRWVDDPNQPIEDIDPPEVTCSHDSRTYGEPITVTLSVKDNIDPAPKVYYTTDGSSPTTSSPFFTNSGQIKFDTSGEKSLKYFAKDSSDNSSPMVTKMYVMKITDAQPVIEAWPQPGQYNEALTVTIEATDNKDEHVTVYFSRNGSQPDENSSSFKDSEQFEISGNGNHALDCYAKNSSGNETYKTFPYSIDATNYPATDIAPSHGGTYLSNVEITLTPSKKIKWTKYTIDGSDPDDDIGILYEKPFTLIGGRNSKCEINVAKVITI